MSTTQTLILGAIAGSRSSSACRSAGVAHDLAGDARGG